MEPRRARKILQQRLDELDGLQPRADAEFKEWFERTMSTVNHALPAGHRAHNGLTMARWAPAAVSSRTGPDAYTRAFERGRDSARAYLKAAIFELDQLSEHTDDVVQPILAVHEVKLLERVIRELRGAEDNGEFDELNPELRAEVLAETAALEAQLRSPKPKRSIVRAALGSLRNIMEQAVGGAVGGGLIVAVKMASDGIL